MMYVSVEFGIRSKVELELGIKPSVTSRRIFVQLAYIPRFWLTTLALSITVLHDWAEEGTSDCLFRPVPQGMAQI